MDAVKVIDNTSNNHTKKTYNTSNGDARRADDQIFYCIECNYCWEYASKIIKKQDRYLTYNNFPTYKRKRLLCPKHHKE